MKNAHINVPESNLTYSDVFCLSKQQFYHIKQRKATNIHSSDAGTREYLTFLLEK